MNSLTTHTKNSLKECALFTVIGQSLVEECLLPELGKDGQIVGFICPNGNPVEHCLAFEIEGKTAGYLYLTTNQHRPLLGFHKP